MVVKSQPHKKKDVYEWIKIIQESPEDKVTQEKIVKAYDKLVHSLAHKYSKNQSHHEDLFQVGMIGLLVAVQRYDESYGGTFETFAIPTIIGEIKRFIRDKTWSVHVPRRIKELGPKINATLAELTEVNQKTPQISEIADHLNVSEEEILETMEMSNSYKALSADTPQQSDSEEGNASILDMIGNQEEGYDKIDTRILLEKILPILAEREQRILQCIFFDNMSQQETADLLNLSQMHVSRLQREALKKLKEALEEEGIYRF
ncbi:MAG TPA: RNA polymerase sigma factor SigB [Pseudogracilibacillus sp.]|nr:RNA polymerase sigma factor SigB [Pseudogracilibacillus sp.]